MATSLHYQHVTALIGVPDPVLLQAIRGTLYHLGVRSMDYFSSLAELKDAVALRTPDVLVVATELDPDVPRVITRIRHGELGSNPFLPIIMVTTHATQETVQIAVECGADDLLPHPWDTGYLDQRLEKLIAERRPFVVTSDYVGPDRRNHPRPGSAYVEPMVVPNPLRAKALERRTEESIRAEISAGSAMLNEDKVRRLAELVVRLINELEQRVAEGEGTSSLSGACLEKMVASCLAIHKRLPGTMYVGGATVCRSLAEAARKAHKQVEAETSPDVTTLRPLLTTFIQMFHVPDEIVHAGLPEHLRERLPELRLRKDFM